MIESPVLASYVISRARRRRFLTVAGVMLRTVERAGIRDQSLAGSQVCELRIILFLFPGGFVRGKYAICLIREHES